MVNSRIHWIDIAKAFGIIAVIYGHTLTSDSYRYLLYAFHIPLFFYISGLVHHYKRSQGVLDLLISSIKNNLIPYFVFAFLTYAAVIFIQEFRGITWDKFIYQIDGIFYGNGNKNYLSFNVALWFLPCLFITKLTFNLLEKLSNSPKFLIITIITFSVVGYLVSIFFTDLKLPFGIETALTGIVFYGLGYLMGNRRNKISSIVQRYGIYMLPIVIATCVIFANLNYELYGYQIDMRLNRLSNYFYFYIASLSGITAILIASILISRNKILEYIGRNSLILYVWHWVILTLIWKYTDPLINTTNTVSNIYLAPIYTGLSIGIILAVNILKKRASMKLSKPD